MLSCNISVLFYKQDFQLCTDALWDTTLRRGTWIHGRELGRKPHHCLSLLSKRTTTKWGAAAHQYCDSASSAVTDSHSTVLAEVEGITGTLLKYVYMSCFIHKQKLALSTLHSETARALKLCQYFCLPAADCTIHPLQLAADFFIWKANQSIFLNRLNLHSTIKNVNRHQLHSVALKSMPN